MMLDDSLILAVRKRVYASTGSDDLAQEACIELLNIDLDSKPIDYIIADLVKKYRRKLFYGRKMRREIPVSELVNPFNRDESSEDFIDGLTVMPIQRHLDIEKHIPDNLKEAVRWLTLGYTLEESARQCGISYEALRKRFFRVMSQLAKQ